MRQREIKWVRKKTCSKCNKVKEDSRHNQRYCKKCHAENMRNTRPKYCELNEHQRLKANCRSYTKEYIKRGKILIMPCWVCNKKAETHHEDYNNPRDVIWLCREHHLMLHKFREQADKPK